MARMRFTILGCGASPGVPRINGDWGDCDPNEPRNRRSRSSAMFELFGAGDRPTRVVIDTGPDFRAQLIAANAREIAAVLFTHSHADHIHGIDDLRAFWMASRRPIAIYSDDYTQARLNEGFGYCFRKPEGSPYPPFLARNRIVPGTAFRIDGPGGSIHFLPLQQFHGDIRSLGFRVGPIAYSCDFHDLPPATVAALSDLDVWVLDALRRWPHPSHCSLEEAISWAGRIKPRQAVLTHMTNELDYQTLAAELPEPIVPAHDGMVFDFIIPDSVTEASANS